MPETIVNPTCPRCHEILVLKPITKFRIGKGIKTLESNFKVLMCPQCDYHE